jgi:hypothetical protein
MNEHKATDIMDLEIKPPPQPLLYKFYQFKYTRIFELTESKAMLAIQELVVKAGYQ